MRQPRQQRKKNQSEQDSERALRKARERNRRYHQKHAEQIRSRARAKYAADIDAAREKQRLWRKANPGRVKEIHARYREKSANAIRQSHRAWSASNKEAITRYRRARKTLKGDEVRKYSREWARQKRNKEPSFVLISRLRCRTRSALRTASARSSTRSVALLGCTRCQLARHIEGMFSDGMSWDNMRLWHVDHIVPVSAFDLTDDEQQRAAFHYTNLQPLWAEDNLRKSNKLPGQHLFGLAYAASIALGDSQTRRKKAKDGWNHGDD